ncbi:PREDICTED: cytochrome P450 71B23 [Camelina sativa]|uniref:Cytochrome P450 71B23 n=1 Tax=Camelina sativa TaxID=90675 RepID=A0ABM0TER8_CAMSA|nr:PREDICTED: cytochrome P450 71B23 [Camelina sativa]
MSIFLCFLWLVLLLLVTIIFTRKSQSSKLKLPPGPPKLPIIGNLHYFKGLPHRCLLDLSKIHGPVMQLQFGFVPLVVISSNHAAQEVLKTHDLDCCSRPETIATKTISYNFKDIGFAPYGEEWRALRKLAVIELFSLKKLNAFRYIREEENDLLVKKLSEASQKQSPVNLKKALFTLSASIVCRLAFGQNLHESEFIDEDSMEDLASRSEKIQAKFAFSDFFPGGWILDRITGQSKSLNGIFADLDGFFNQVLDDHLKPGRRVLETPDVVDVMIDMMNKQSQDGSFQLTTDHIKGVISDIFLAGVNTSSTTILWAMTELMRSPRVMKKVQDEVRTVLGGKRERITEQDLNQLNYFKLVIKETFRLHPAAPLLLPREVMSQIKIQDYDIPEKTQIMVNVYAIGRDPNLWENPDEFKPERFADSSVDYRGLNFELLPFGSGRRICPGMTMGIATVELGLLNLLYFFNWGLPEGRTVKDIDLEEEGATIVGKKVSLQLVPTRRQ